MAAQNQERLSRTYTAQEQAQANASHSEDDEALMNTLANAFGDVHTAPADKAARKKESKQAPTSATKKHPAKQPDDAEIWEEAAEALNESDNAENTQESEEEEEEEEEEEKEEEEDKSESEEQDEDMEQEPHEEEDETMEYTTEEDEMPQPDPELLRRSQAELQDIRTSLDKLAHELDQIVSGVISNKKQVLMTEECLTKAMLKIDSVESGGDDSIRKQRKELIGRTEQLLERVDEFKHRTKTTIPHRAQ
ncbi:hypothetical protein BGX23_012200 [Mortierella sp. AD031]|nr:hypothetical protein BGX23_012200 [Mortierella sp. AD031]